MPEEASNLCRSCGGDGDIGGEFCYSCLGTGHREDTGMHIFLKELVDKVDDVMGKCNDIKEKVDEIKEVVDAL